MELLVNFPNKKGAMMQSGLILEIPAPKKAVWRIPSQSLYFVSISIIF
jgi:hypothetical protein